MDKSWAKLDTSEEVLEEIIECCKGLLAEEKKHLWMINIPAIILYLFEIFILKEVDALNVIAMSFMVTSHYNYILSYQERTAKYKLDIKMATIVLDAKQCECHDED